MLQQQNFTESLGSFYQCMMKPMVDLTQLNIETLNHFTRDSNYINNLMQIKKPEDWFAVQIKMANKTGLYWIRYLEEASEIILQANNQSNKIFSEISKESIMNPVKFEETMNKMDMTGFSGNSSKPLNSKKSASKSASWVNATNSNSKASRAKSKASKK